MPLHPSTSPNKNSFKLARYVVSKISSLVKSLASQRSLNVRPVSHQAVEHPPSIYQAPRDVIPDWQSDDERTLVSSPLSISFLDEDKKARQGGPTASAAKHVPFQEVLDRWERHPYLDLDINAMTLTHKGPNYAAAAARAGEPVPCIGIFYYEVAVEESRSIRRDISVGLAYGTVGLSELPGWANNSCGYHAGDGRIYYSLKCHRKLPISVHTCAFEVLGCGIDFFNRFIFFTRDGKIVGFKRPRNFDSIKDKLYPMVGMAESKAMIHINFGNKPFKYRFQDFPSKKPLSEHSVSLCRLPPEVVTSILDYLVPVIHPRLDISHSPKYKHNLGACALTCRDWAQKCRPLMYRQITLYSGEDLDRLLDLMEDPSSPIPYSIRKLRLHDSSVRAWTYRALLIFSQKLLNLERIELVHAAEPNAVLLPQLTGTLLALISSFSKLRYMVLTNYHFETFSEFTFAISPLRNLEELECRAISWGGPVNMTQAAGTYRSSGCLPRITVKQCQDPWAFVWLLVAPSRWNQSRHQQLSHPTIAADHAMAVSVIARCFNVDSFDYVFKYLYNDLFGSWDLSIQIPLRGDTLQLKLRLVPYAQSGTSNSIAFLAGVYIVIPRVGDLVDITKYDWPMLDEILSNLVCFRLINIGFPKWRYPRALLARELETSMPRLHGQAYLRMEFERPCTARPRLGQKWQPNSCEILMGRHLWGAHNEQRSILQDVLDVITMIWHVDRDAITAEICDVALDQDKTFACVTFRDYRTAVALLEQWERSGWTDGVGQRVAVEAWAFEYNPLPAIDVRPPTYLQDLLGSGPEMKPVCWLKRYERGWNARARRMRAREQVK